MKIMWGPLVLFFGGILFAGSLLWTLVEAVSWVLGGEFNTSSAAALVVFGMITLVSWIDVKKSMEDEKTKNDEIYKKRIADTTNTPVDGADLGV